MILSVKLKNAIKKLLPDAEFHLKNILINGCKKGCSGFIVNPDTSKIVYVNTEGITWIGQGHQNLYRNANNLKDYTGKRNRWSYDKDIAESIVNLLKSQDTQ